MYWKYKVQMKYTKQVGDVWTKKDRQQIISDREFLLQVKGLQLQRV